MLRLHSHMLEFPLMKVLLESLSQHAIGDIMSFRNSANSHSGSGLVFGYAASLLRTAFS